MRRRERGLWAFWGEIALKHLAERLGLLLACALPLAHAADKPAQPFQVTNDHPGEFEVIYHRVTPKGIGAVAGLIGVAIQQGIQSSDDSEMAKQVLASNPNLACDQPLLTALKSKLQSSGSYVLDESANNEQDLVVEIDIADCGLRLADSNALQLSSYVNFTLKVRPPGGESWSEDIQISGRSRHSFDEFAHQQGLASTEVTDVLTRAGVRAADKLIYKR